MAEDKPKQQPNKPKHVPLSKPSTRNSPKPGQNGNNKGGGTGVRPKTSDS